MRNWIEKLLRNLDIENKRYRIFGILAVLVLILTVIPLILPAVTLTKKEKVLDCHYEVHQHTEDCYEEVHDEHGQKRKKLTCGYADYVVHMHDENCFDKKGNLVCDLPEIRKHVHNEDCYEEKKILSCGKKEGEDHEHTEECYETEKVLTCGKNELHTHNEDCYDEEEKLTCGKLQLEAHQHEDTCFVEKEVEDTEEVVLTLKEITADAVETSEAQEEDNEEKGGSASFDEKKERKIFFLFNDKEDEDKSEDTETVSEPEGSEQAQNDRKKDDQDTLTEEKDTSDPGKDDGKEKVSEEAVTGETAIKSETVGDDSDSYTEIYRIDTDQGGRQTAYDIIFKNRTEHVTVQVVADQDAFPKGTRMSVKEVEDQQILDAITDVLENEIKQVHAVDITFINEDGEEIEPAAPIRVTLSSAIVVQAEDPLVVHVDDQGKAELVDLIDETELSKEQAEDALVFETQQFSVYAIVEAPDPVETAGWLKVTSLEDIAEMGSKGFYISHVDGYYFTRGITQISGSRTGITKTAKVNSPEGTSGKVLYYFEQAEEAQDQFYVYCYDEDGRQKQYVKQTGNSLSLVPESEAMTFTVNTLPSPANAFSIEGTGGYYWNMQGGAGGKSFAAYNSATDVNARFCLWYYLKPEEDPYDLDGKTFGILFSDDTILGKALMSEQDSEGTLAAKELPILDMKDRSKIYVAKNSNISEWTFHYVSDFDYHITTVIDGETRYLTINGSSVTLEKDPADQSLIRISSGSGAYEGKYNFCVDGYSLNLVNTPGDRKYNGSENNSETIWINLVETKEMTEDDLLIYSAHKVSVSDEEDVYDIEGEAGSHQQSQVVIYTRVWNEKTLKYEFYAIDHDGSLIRVYESGDVIQWVENSINTALWDFTEYHYDDGTPNYYYELRNSQYGEYIAPQVTGNQILSDSALGINLNGRRYGYDYTTIIAWDDDNYQYVGLKVKGNQLVPCPLSEAEDFYFAIIREHDPGKLTTVETVDNDDYGITMKMIDFKNPLKDTRDSVQTAFFGTKDIDKAGLVSTNLTDGYPTTTPLTGHEASLSELYKASDLKTVNHLFIQSTYNESGYFEYDSTQNYAYLGDGTDFTVYDQLGTVSPASTARSTNHGQFLPYSSIINPETGEPWPYSKTYSNTTTTTNQKLPETDPRYGEPMHEIPHTYDNYYFGMELEASFTQTVSGLDAWGHDIIFEFSGDDDFWLYVDGELILDLGGVHSAMTGSVNFRTGLVTSSRGNSTLYQLFRQHYKDRGMSEEEISTKLSEIFHENGSGQYVFKDYTSHTMKMFYMERGAGASNLHMRFNLAAVKPGTFILSKTLSGTENRENDLIEFPYQIWYYTTADGESSPHLLTEKTGSIHNVVYEGTATKVKYLHAFTPAGGSEEYEDVFFLKPGQSAEVTLPANATRYYVTECGVNPDIYDKVTANGEELTGKTTANTLSGTARQDFATSPASLEERSTVKYDNHVQEGAMRTLSITKRLYDVDGITKLKYPDNETLFSFRLYLGNENEDAGSLPLANMYDYCIKDAEGNYCRWNAKTQTFVSFGKKDYTELTKEEKEEATFTTSMNGSISKIPVDHTVEVRNLIIGTQYEVEERNYEIPRGYTLRSGDGYTRVDVSPEVKHKDEPIIDTIHKEEDPAIEVRNQKGWGLTVNKVWTDKDFMESHDDIYIAVYIREDKTADGKEGTSYILYDGTVRRLETTETEIYYFFNDLKYDDTTYKFSDFVVREVTISETDPVIEDGLVTNPGTVTPIDNNGKLIIGGKPSGGNHQDGYDYTVNYSVGQSTGRNENVRTDTVTNARPGIELYKTDWDGESLSGAVFTLKDQEGRNVAASSYRSDRDGLITTAYLSDGTYTLTETAAPKGYVVLDSPMTITVKGNRVTVHGINEEYYTVDMNPASDGDGNTRQEAADADEGTEYSKVPYTGMLARITIRNRPAALQIKKVDASLNTSIAGVHFALYQEVTSVDGTRMKDFKPMTGYGDLVTDQNGILSEIGMNLGAGTYFLTETEASEGYDKLTEDLCFTIGNDGTVAVHGDDYSSWLTTVTDEDTGMTSYTIAIPNDKTKKVSFKKVDVSAPDTSALEGAIYDLYQVEEGQQESLVYSNMISGTDGMMSLDGQSVFPLPAGTYHLVETTPPEGYSLNENAVVVKITEDDVTYNDGSSHSKSGKGKDYEEETGVYTLKIANYPDYELPSSGGMGSRTFLMIGGLVALLAGLGLLARRRPDLRAGG